MKNIIGVISLIVVFSIWLVPLTDASISDIWKKCEIHGEINSDTNSICCFTPTGYQWLTGASCPPPPKSITVSVPNGGEGWKIGTSQTISWTTTGSITNVKIELSRNGVAGSYEVLFASASNGPSGGSVSWPVSGLPTNNAIIRITDFSDATVSDVSNNSFRITTAIVTTINNVEDDATSPYVDVVDDGNTDIVVDGETGMSCRWYDTDIGYTASSGTACTTSGTQATCTVSPTSNGNSYTEYVSCIDSLGNAQNATENLDVSWSVLIGIPPPPSDGILTGTVRDVTTGVPLSGATVTATGPGSGTTTTNSTGGYTMTLPPGSYTVTASKFGYSSVSGSASLIAGATTALDFYLVPSSLQLFYWTTPKKITNNAVADDSPSISCTNTSATYWYCAALWVQGSNLKYSWWDTNTFTWTPEDTVATGSFRTPSISCLNNRCWAIVPNTGIAHNIYSATAPFGGWVPSYTVGAGSTGSAAVSCATSIYASYGDFCTFAWDTNSGEIWYGFYSTTISWSVSMPDGGAMAIPATSFDPSLSCSKGGDGNFGVTCILVYKKLIGGGAAYKVGPNYQSAPTWYPETTEVSIPTGGITPPYLPLSCAPTGGCILSWLYYTGLALETHYTYGDLTIHARSGCHCSIDPAWIKTATMQNLQTLSCSSFNNCISLGASPDIRHSRWDGNVINSFNLQGTIPTVEDDYAPAVSCPNSQFCMGNWYNSNGVSSDQEILYSIGTPAPCTRTNPTVTITPAEQQGDPGNIKNYVVTVNNNNAFCYDEIFDLSISGCPAGWTCSLPFGSSVAMLSGTSKSTTLSITSSAESSAGTYPVTVMATYRANPTYTGSGVAKYTIVCTNAIIIKPIPNYDQATKHGDFEGTQYTWTLSFKDSSSTSCPTTPDGKIIYNVPSTTLSGTCHADTGIYTISSTPPAGSKQLLPYYFAVPKSGDLDNVFKVFTERPGEDACTLSFNINLDTQQINSSSFTVRSGASSQSPQISFFDFSGDLTKFDTEWEAFYPDDPFRTMEVKCGLNCDPQTADCGSIIGQGCLPYPVQHGAESVKKGSCAVSSPTYNFAATNKIMCLFYDPINPSLKTFVDHDFTPVDFELNYPPKIVADVGSSFDLKIDISNKGLLRDTYRVDLTGTETVSISPESVTTEVVDRSKSVSVFSSITPLVDQSGQLTLKVTSLTSGKVVTKTIELNPKLFILPEFGLLGLIQIIAIATIVYFLFASRLFRVKKSRRRKRK